FLLNLLLSYGFIAGREERPGPCFAQGLGFGNASRVGSVTLAQCFFRRADGGAVHSITSGNLRLTDLGRRGATTLWAGAGRVCQGSSPNCTISPWQKSR